MKKKLIKQLEEMAIKEGYTINTKETLYFMFISAVKENISIPIASISRNMMDENIKEFYFDLINPKEYHIEEA